MTARHSKQRQAGISLVGTALFAMSVAALAMLGLFYFRYQSLPWHDNWGYWLKGTQAKPAASTSASPTPAANSSLRQAATVKEGIKRCQIDGKTVYSDTLCHAQSSSLQLHDNVAPATRAPIPTTQAASASAAASRLNPD